VEIFLISYTSSALS